MDKTIWVVSHVYWNGAEQGGGGFWWYPDRDTALLAYADERRAWCEYPARIRLVRVDVPPSGQVCVDNPCYYDDPITCWLDSRIDELETGLPAEKVWISAGVRL